MAVAALSPPATALITYEKYSTELHLEGRYDIIDGEIIEMAGASWRHQEIVGRLYEALRAFQRAKDTGRTLMAPFDVLITRVPLRTRQPDVFFISKERLESSNGAPADGPLTAGPELIVEVLSPSETPRTVREKLADFVAVGTREAWLVSAESETVQVLRLSENSIEPAAVYIYGQTIVSEAVPDLHVAVSDLFDA